MSETVGPKEKAILLQTVAPFVRGLIGLNTYVELKNETQVLGIIIASDCYMNITMEDVTLISPFTGEIGKFSFFFIQNKFIRMINIPSHLDAEQVFQREVDIASGEFHRKRMREAKLKRAATLRAKEAKRMAQTSDS